MLVFLCSDVWSLLLKQATNALICYAGSPNIPRKSYKHRISHPPTKEVLVQVDKTMLWFTAQNKWSAFTVWVNIQIEGMVK